MPSISDFYGIDTAPLTTLQAQFLECLTAIAVAGQSYTIAGRQFNRAHIGEVRETIAALQAALDRADGSSPTKTFARF